MSEFATETELPISRNWRSLHYFVYGYFLNETNFNPSSTLLQYSLKPTASAKTDFKSTNKIKHQF